MSVENIDVNAILLEGIKEKDLTVSISITIPKSLKEKLITATARETEKRRKKVGISAYIVEAVKEKLIADGYF